MASLEHTGHKNPTRASASTTYKSKGYKAVRMGPVGSQDNDLDADVLVAEPKTKPKRPSLYRVVLLNDDYTPMDFVVNVLEQIFRKNHEDAIDIMMTVHTKGAATCGIYTRDVAETKIDQVVEYARINDYPLQCVMEKE
ncbi:MAG: ATP-dependent Clp protease adapter ClpS [Rickettsiales bacterium]|nr:ATP-dependent Clp protease adapter ClpS [Rickettsiales bacterium]